MANASDRLKQLRAEKGWSMRELVRQINFIFPQEKIDASYISRYEQGKIEPNFKNAKMLATVYQVPLDYLMGESNDRCNINFIDGLNSKINTEMLSCDSGKPIKVLGRVPAGTPIEAIDEFVDIIYIPQSWDRGGYNYVGLKVKGDSMLPKYQNNDVVVIRQQDTCENGDDCVVFVDDDYNATLKKVILQDDTVILQPLNSAYEPIVTTRNNIKIFGKVVELRRKI